MKILIAYASTEGQTRKICRFCADQLFTLGHSVEMLNAADGGALEMSRFDAVILAGSVHGGRLQGELAEFAQTHAGPLNRMPSLLLQVSLAIAGNSPEEHTLLDRIAADFCAAANWQPGAVHHIAGAFRFTQYDFFKSWAMRYIAAQKEQDIDPQGDTEFTDWPALASLMQDWTGAIGAKPEDRTTC